MEQILVRNLPPGTKSALRARAARNHRALEAEAREILTTAARSEAPTMVDFLAMPEASTIEFEPQRLGIRGRSVEL